jgi:hypothetical protein
MASDSERRIRGALIEAVHSEFDWGITLHAHIDDKLHAFEIKSERDQLTRLRKQTRYYNEACSECTVVVHETHEDVAFSVPPWWGIWTARETADGVSLAVARNAKPNPEFDSTQLARILRSTELARVVRANDPTARISMLTKDELVRRARGLLGDDVLAQLSLEILRTRKTWTSRQLGVATEEERLEIARRLPRPQLGVRALTLPLRASA